MSDTEIQREAAPVQPPVDLLVMPIILEDGQEMIGTIYLSMLREDLAEKHFAKTLDQIARDGGVTPSQMVSLKDHRWMVPVSDVMGLSILNHCFRGGWGVDDPA
jgi:hypothetical protein